MLINLAIGLTTMVLCLSLQLVLLIRVLYYYNQHKALVTTPAFSDTLIVIGGVMLLLLLGNLMQIAIWGGLFVYLGEFAHFTDAFYHSAVNYATLGYGDIVMSERHKLLGPLESLNGILMIGVSSSVLMTAMQHALRKTLVARGELSLDQEDQQD